MQDVSWVFLHAAGLISSGGAQGEIFAAEGFGKVTGEVGVCIATSGPGATNLVTGLADALLDSVPMVAITGQARNCLLLSKPKPKPGQQPGRCAAGLGAHDGHHGPGAAPSSRKPVLCLWRYFNEFCGCWTCRPSLSPPQAWLACYVQSQDAWKR